MADRDRGHRNSNERGNAATRRARRAWLVSPEAPYGGDGHQATCHAPTGPCACGRSWPCPYRRSAKHRPPVCGAVVTLATLVVGRIVPWHQGGRYERGNIRPECARCSCREGQAAATAIRRARFARAARTRRVAVDHG